MHAAIGNATVGIWLLLMQRWILEDLRCYGERPQCVGDSLCNKNLDPVFRSGNWIVIGLCKFFCCSVSSSGFRLTSLVIRYMIVACIGTDIVGMYARVVIYASLALGSF